MAEQTSSDLRGCNLAVLICNLTTFASFYLARAVWKRQDKRQLNIIPKRLQKPAYLYGLYAGGEALVTAAVTHQGNRHLNYPIEALFELSELP